MAAEKIMIVDDEPEAIENCRRLLSRSRYTCVVEADAQRALAVLECQRPQVLLTDLRMPGLDGLALLKAAKRIDPRIKVVLLTAYASLQTAVASMRHGAFDYLAKPFTGEELRAVVRRALGEAGGDTSGGPAGAVPQGKSVCVRACPGGVIGQSAATQAVREVIERVAGTEASILLTGERGTGKEFVARVIHEASARQGQPFVPVNCLACEETALEAQLFGVESVDGSQAGLLESAQGGTLLLDEVGGLSPRLQAKVMRALKEHRGRRMGGVRLYEIDVRVMAVSTQDLSLFCRQGTFREDLYAYVSVVPIALRPLCERVEDIDALAQWFLDAWLLHQQGGMQDRPGISPRARRRLRRYSWPGNVRELRSAIEQAAVQAGRLFIDSQDLPDHLRVSGVVT